MKQRGAPKFVLGYVGFLLTLITVFSLMFLAIPANATPTWQRIIIMFLLGFTLSVPTLFRHFKTSDVDPTRADNELYFGFIAFIGIGFVSAAIGLLNGYIFTAQDTFEGILTTLVAAVPEEFLFAGGLFGLMLLVVKGKYRFWIANMTPAVIFSFYHYYVYGYVPETMLVLFAGRTILDYSYYYRRDLSVPIIGHLLLNAMSLLGGLLR